MLLGLYFFVKTDKNANKIPKARIYGGGVMVVTTYVHN